MFEVEEEINVLENPVELENIEKERKRFHLNNFHLLNRLSSAYCKCKRNQCQLSRITPVSSQVLTVFYNSMPINTGIELALLRGCLEALGKLLKLENWHKKLEKL